jgi:hypothetical protein
MKSPAATVGAISVIFGPMAIAGYSGTPLVQKLGIKAGHRLAIVEAPPGFDTTLGTLPPGVAISRRGGKAGFDVIVWFVTEQAALKRRFAREAGRLDPAGGLWIAWPKKASGIATDVTDNTVRAVALDAGLVDNKVCAIDEVWSGLRCVRRRKDRP